MQRILQPGKNTWCEHPVAEAGLLVDADDYYRAVYRAAEKAERYILLSGWQFDSGVPLLRGAEAEAAELPVTLKSFLDALCDRNPKLEIYILAWDFHVVFALEREWVQKLVFHWTTNERLKFRFDSSHVDQGCHHQKFVVVDGELSFVGGLDLCDSRWDDRKHLESNPMRVSRGAEHKPFHDVQSYLRGPEVAESLEALFVCRWKAAGGDPITLQKGPPTAVRGQRYAPIGGIEIVSDHVALSRTDPHGSPTTDQPTREVLDLYLDAIAAAESSIYIETQYFSSREVGEALVGRLKRGGPALDVVVVLNMAAEKLKEQVAVGLSQAKIISELREAAQGTEHQLGIYYTVPACEGDTEPERATYVHSKVMIVDDRWLNVGSANLTNRSGSVDTELNASFETTNVGDRLAMSIRRARFDLLSEHLGAEVATLEDGMVASLDRRAASKDGRLRLHPSPTEKERAALEVIDPQQLPFDPEGIEGEDERKSIFVRGISALWQRFASGRDDRK